MSEEIEKLGLTDDTTREIPITFRFPRGTSGRELAVKFNQLLKEFGIKNRSKLLRKCIEDTYTAVFDTSAIIINGTPVDQEAADLIRQVLSALVKQEGNSVYTEFDALMWLVNNMADSLRYIDQFRTEPLLEG